jgi:hypothetical protein
MSESPEHPATLYRRIVGAAVATVVIGGIIVLLGIGFGWGGLGGGFALGGGIGLALAGTYFWGYGNGLRRPVSRATWLPSRDARG